jgi:hypothetical protein
MKYEGASRGEEKIATDYLCTRQCKKKNAVDITNFPGGPPPEYSSDSKTLNCADRTGYGVFILI